MEVDGCGVCEPFVQVQLFAKYNTFAEQLQQITTRAVTDSCLFCIRDSNFYTAGPLRWSIIVLSLSLVLSYNSFQMRHFGIYHIMRSVHLNNFSVNHAHHC